MLTPPDDDDDPVRVAPRDRGANVDRAAVELDAAARRGCPGRGGARGPGRERGQARGRAGRRGRRGLPKDTADEPAYLAQGVRELNLSQPLNDFLHRVHYRVKRRGDRINRTL